MVYTIAQQFLHNKNAFGWTPALRQEYEELLKIPTEVKALEDQLAVSRKPRRFLKILRDLRKSNEAFIILRYSKELGRTFVHSSEAELPIMEKHKDFFMSVCAEMVDLDAQNDTRLHASSNLTTTGPNTMNDSVKNQSVHALREYISTCAKEVFHKAGFHGKLVPWSRIKLDIENHTMKGPGHFIPQLLSPHNLSREDCLKVIHMLETETLTFHKYEKIRRKRNVRRRRTVEVVSEQTPNQMTIQPQATTTNPVVTVLKETISTQLVAAATENESLHLAGNQPAQSDSMSVPQNQLSIESSSVAIATEAVPLTTSSKASASSRRRKTVKQKQAPANLSQGSDQLGQRKKNHSEVPDTSKPPRGATSTTSGVCDDTNDIDIPPLADRVPGVAEFLKNQPVSNSDLSFLRLVEQASKSSDTSNHQSLSLHPNFQNMRVQQPVSYAQPMQFHIGQQLHCHQPQEQTMQTMNIPQNVFFNACNNFPNGQGFLQSQLTGLVTQPQSFAASASLPFNVANMPSSGASYTLPQTQTQMSETVTLFPKK